MCITIYETQPRQVDSSEVDNATDPTPVSRTEEDYWRIQAFLRQTMLDNGLAELSWHVARLDYWRWHVVENCRACDAVEQTTFIWEAPDGRIAAVLNPEGRGEAHFQAHPAMRTRALEEEMLQVAEDHLAIPGADGRTRLIAWADSSDELRRDLLARRGYKVADWPDASEHQRRQRLSAPIPPVAAPAGYMVRPLGDVTDSRPELGLVARVPPRRAGRKVRGMDVVPQHPAAAPLPPRPGHRRGAGSARGYRVRASRRDRRVLHRLVRRRDAHRYFEPVGTTPEHQRRGLGRAVMTEALRRLQRMGCVVAFVGGYSIPANALYASAGFREYDLS